MLTENEKRKSKELEQKSYEFLKKLYFTVDGFTLQHADMNEIGKDLYLSREEIDRITTTLFEEGKVKCYNGTTIDITFSGVMHIETNENDSLIEQKKIERMAYLINLYRKTEGNIRVPCYYTELGFDKDQSIQIVTFLCDARLIDFKSSRVNLTQLGKDAVEKANSDKLEFNDAFEPVINLNIGQLINSQVMANSPGGSQVMNIVSYQYDLDEISHITNRLKEILTGFTVSEEEKQLILDIVKKIDKEILKEKPNRAKIKEYFCSFLTHIAGAAAYTYLCNIAPELINRIKELISISG